MKKSIYIGSISIVIISITGISSSFAANTITSRNRSLPPEFSTLSETEIATLKTLTGSALEEYLTSKGIAPLTEGSGSLRIKHGSGNTNKDGIPEILSLTDEEKTALKDMTESERNAFFASKGITHSTNTGSGMQIRQNKNSQLSSPGTTNTTINKNTQSRTERLAKQKAKILEQKKAKIQKKISAKERLTRLEKNFAKENDIEY